MAGIMRQGGKGGKETSFMPSGRKLHFGREWHEKCYGLGIAPGLNMSHLACRLRLYAACG